MRDQQLSRSLAGFTALTLVGALAWGGGGGDEEFVWDADKARHLLNRAGFGARAGQVQRAVELGREAQVAELITGAFCDPFFFEPIERPTPEQMRDLDEDGRRKLRNQATQADRRLMTQFTGWWIDQMIDGRDPLRERMTLFWHGYFTSSYRDVRDSAAMIEQNELLRQNALGSFGTLVKGIVRDPAMLEYLDNNQNRKGNPNENFARELMELFTLGEGNYSEEDIKAAARALTGWTTRRGDADPRFVARRHDNGKKRILGTTGNFDADGLVELLLDQKACPRHVAGKLLTYFEGTPPDEARLADYASYLKQNDYQIDLFLARLFNDLDFYRPAVLGNKISGPIDYLVGTARRLGSEPPGELIWVAAGQLGQRLLDPPNVKGWDGGRSWITTSTFLQRGNFAGMMLGVVRVEDVLAADPELEGELMMAADDSMEGEVMDPASDDEPAGRRPGPGAARTQTKPRLSRDMTSVRRLLGADGYRPGVHLSARARRNGATTDAEVIDGMCAELLAVPVTDEGRATLVDFMLRERAALEIADGELFARDHSVDTEKLLRRLAHLILSLPEAQLC